MGDNIMAADYIVYGDYVLTMNDSMTVQKNGAVAVKDNKIVEIGDSIAVMKKHPEAKTIGGKGHIVMPGLINTHNHAPMVYLRGIADDLPLKEWLEQHIWPTESKFLCPEYVHDATQLACLEMLKSGTTTFADMYFYCHEMSLAVKSIGLRAMLGETCFDFPTAAVKCLDEYFKRAEEFIVNWKHDELIIPSISPHAPYTCSPDTLKKAENLAEKYGAPIQIHLAETAWEVSEIQNKYGKTPTGHLDAIGFLDSNVIAAHCVWTNEQDIEILAKRGVGVAHCVESNLKLASGTAPVPQMIKAGVKVSFGTDGAASNNDLNLFSEMSTAAKFHKNASNDPTVLDAKTAVLMATKWGAKALGINNLGYLAPNCLADIITIDLQKPHLIPMFDVYSHLVYAVNAADVSNVMVNGKLLLRDGKTVAGDDTAILQKAQEWHQKIVNK